MFITGIIGSANCPLVHVSDRQVMKMQRRNLNGCAPSGLSTFPFPDSDRGVSEAYHHHNNGVGGTGASSAGGAAPGLGMITPLKPKSSLLRRSLHPLMHTRGSFLNSNNTTDASSSLCAATTVTPRRRPSMLWSQLPFNSDESVGSNGSEEFELHGGKRRMMIRKLSSHSSLFSNASNSPRGKISDSRVITPEADVI